MAPFLLGVRMDVLTPFEVQETCARALAGYEQRLVVTPNPEFILEAQKDAVFRELLNQAFLSLPDGAGLAYALKALTGETLFDRHPGVDTLWMLAELCAQSGKTLVLCGGGKGIAAEAAEAMREKYPALEVIGIDPGLVQKMPDSSIKVDAALREQLARLAPTVLAVGLGQNKQERFLAQIMPDLPSIRIGIGIGGALDMIAGKIPRAPEWMQKRGLEWMWRWHLEPTRALRMMRATIIFPIRIAWVTIHKRHFLRSVRDVLQEIKRQFS